VVNGVNGRILNMISAELARKLVLDRYEADLETAIRKACALGCLNITVTPRTVDELNLAKGLAVKAGYTVEIVKRRELKIWW
jgi:hypothetical protein